jgi:hypothetical protein
MSTTEYISAAAQASAGPRPILPDDAGYEEACRAWNLAADQRPAAVIIARSETDVIHAIEFAATCDLRVVPQSTGHLAAALPPLDGCLLLRTELKGVTVDPANQRARVASGSVWQEVVDAAAPHGLAALSGSSHDVGVTGYTLGGGMSWMARQFGLQCNNIHAIELVTADARLVRCDELHNTELFWAVRGGGGNFGVVTAIEIDLFPITEVFGGMTIWPADQAKEVLTAWARWAPGAPDAATTSFRVVRLPGLPEVPEPLRDAPIVVIDGAVVADARVGAAMLHDWRSVGTPMMDTWEAMPPAGLLQIHMDPPAPVPASGHTAMIRQLDEAGVDAFLAAVDTEVVAPLLCAELRQLGGALGRSAPGDGSRGRFVGDFCLFAVGIPFGPPGTAEALEAKLTHVVNAMEPWQTGSFYLNFGERGGAADGAFDAEALGHLKAIRRAWDPGERFVASHRIATT